MPCDDGAIGLLRHDEPKKIFARLIIGICLRLIASDLSRYRGPIIGNYRLGLGALNRHSGERCECSAKRKHNF